MNDEEAKDNRYSFAILLFFLAVADALLSYVLSAFGVVVSIEEAPRVFLYCNAACLVLAVVAWVGRHNWIAALLAALPVPMSLGILDLMS